MRIGPAETNGCWFRLSNRQKKELLVRGAELQIAIPVITAPIDPAVGEHAGPWHLARLALPEEDPDNITDVTEEIVEVQLNPGDRENVPGLSGVLGRIIDEESPDTPGIRVEISVIVVVLCAVDRPRSRPRLQWPGRAFLSDGTAIPRDEAAEPQT